ncbi:MAG: glycosyltransferase family 4 protein [Candidatus Hydrogenedentes bacterium]|nr:glycosyltransferase family 4 protein [Candidatus Hydrogenedentota bacterium]
MRVAIDAHAIGTGAGGNETYMRELLFALDAHAPNLDVFALMHHGARIEGATRLKTYALANVPSALRVPLQLPVAVLRTRSDLLHVQYNAPPVCPRPYVVSIHDVGWVHHPELFPPAMRGRLNALTPGTLRRAARVFALTEAIRREIADAYGTPIEKIDVVAPGVDPRYFAQASTDSLAAVRAKYGLPDEFVLYVGAVQPRKNLARLAEAFARLKDRGLPHALVIAGKQGWLADDAMKPIAALNLGDRLRFTGYVDARDLPTLMAAAAAFAYVSIYEGFGLPVLEAMACGTPVLASSASAIREVAGDGALCVDALSVDAIEDGLIRVLTDSNLRESLRRKGPLRAAQFTRESMARAAVRGYEKAL